MRPVRVEKKVGNLKFLKSPKWCVGIFQPIAQTTPEGLQIRNLTRFGLRETPEEINPTNFQLDPPQ